MKKAVFLITVGALAACQQEPAEAPATEETVAAEPAEMTVANGSPPGTYTVTMADGSTGTSTINGDGTYVDTGADGTAEEGTWQVIDGKTCFKLNAEGSTQMCWTESAPGEDGSFTATSDAGEVVTVTPAAAAEGETAAE